MIVFWPTLLVACLATAEVDLVAFLAPLTAFFSRFEERALFFPSTLDLAPVLLIVFFSIASQISMLSELRTFSQSTGIPIPKR
jgi:hypothetical protein